MSDEKEKQAGKEAISSVDQELLGNLKNYLLKTCPAILDAEPKSFQSSLATTEAEVWSI
jgi:hypothetical protein